MVALLRDHLAPRLIGRDPAHIEAIWKDLFFATHATAVGAITSLALAAIDTALWDLRCRRAGLPLWKWPAGAQQKVPVYTTEGGWLHLAVESLVEQTVAAKAQGLQGGAKIKVGKPHVSEDVARLAAVREAVGDAFEIMVDANQCFTLSEALRRAPRYAELGIAGSRSRCRPRTCRPPAPRRGQRDADRGRRVALSPAHFPAYLERRGLHRWSRSIARRRHHAVAQGRASGGGVQRARSARTS